MEATSTQWHGRAWRWFVEHAKSNHALAWLAAVSFLDPIVLPVAPEVFLVALMLAHPKRAKAYLAVALASSVAGAAVAYVIARVLFHQFGEPILAFYNARHSFIVARHYIRGHVFWTMALANFGPIPDKVFIYAAGFLGARFFPYLTGYFVGRAVRMSIAVYLADRFGVQALEIIKRYLLGVTVAAVILVTIYGMVHWHLLGL